MIREVIASFESSGRDFILDVADALPRVSADRDKTVQVVMNLVSNAVKYSEGPAPIEVRATAQSGEVAVEVEDRGIGMTDEERAQIFEKFSRVDRPEVRRVGGTGLGLYITSNLVQLQRGRMWVTSRPGEGSVFGFSLPLAGGGRVGERRAREGRDLAETLDR